MTMHRDLKPVYDHIREAQNAYAYAVGFDGEFSGDVDDIATIRFAAETLVLMLRRLEARLEGEAEDEEETNDHA
jgi:hypothetical protein